MTRCVEFWRKWKEEPNFCGLGKTSAKNIEKYLEFVDELSLNHGISTDLIYLNVPHGSISHLLSLKKDSDSRIGASNMIAQTLKSKKGVTQKIVDSFIGKETKKPFIPTKRDIRPCSDPIILTRSVDGELRQKIRAIATILSEGQMVVLYEIQKKYELDNEYSALCKMFVLFKLSVDVVEP